jgi:hypothetical protein
MSRTIILVALCAALPAQARTVAYSIVIGNNAPLGSDDDAQVTRPLRYADDDAVRYHQLLSRLAGEAHLLTVMDADTQGRHPGAAAAARAPTLANVLGIVRAIGPKMAADRSRGDEPVFYLVYSGHGTRSADSTPYLALLDAGLTETVLYDQVLATLPAAYVHLIIDACNAAAVLGVRGFDRELDARSQPLAPSELADATWQRHPAVGAIVATTADEETHEWSRFESGVFTHEVLSGLAGAADVNGDGAVESPDAVDHLSYPLTTPARENLPLVSASLE